MHHDPARAVLQAARRAAREADAPLLLAVSGGLDSMTLLQAMAAVGRARIAAVATFDHGTGPAATRAAGLVASRAGELGLPVVVGRAAAHDSPEGLEDAWRRERYRFLRESANGLGARIVTAHTEDDQVETVLMRVLRGSGARGLAALYAPSELVRPFLGLRRAALERYAEEAGVRWLDDPSNESRAFLRNRLRHDLLPALRTVSPGIDRDLLDAAREAARWRAEVEAHVDGQLRPEPMHGGGLVVASSELAGYDRDSLAVLWGALAGRAGLALDRRGTHRLAEFTISRPRTGTMPLSGGWSLEARRDRYLLHQPVKDGGAPVVLPAQGSVHWGRFRFWVGERDDERGAWSASLPEGMDGLVRQWSAGDRLASSKGQPRRRVKRYLSEAGVSGTDRAAWPVVVAGEDVVWIPGVRRSDAATERSGRPVRYYVCERIDR
jgi:tRNA(Ile)-lysidine synthase